MAGKLNKQLCLNHYGLLLMMPALLMGRTNLPTNYWEILILHLKLSVLLFAAAREAAGVDSVELDVPESATLANVRSALLRSVPKLAMRTGTLLWAVNNEYASDDRVLQASDVVACFPPVSGG